MYQLSINDNQFCCPPLITCILYLAINLFYQGNSVPILLPYGSAHGDSTLPRSDDGYSNEIRLGTDVVIFGSSYNGLYVSLM